MKPIPSPYDIMPLPRFAYAPGPIEWSILAALAVAAAALLFFLRRCSARRRSRTNVLRIAIAEMEKLAAVQADREALAKTSLILRRAVSYWRDVDITALAPAELNALLLSGRAGIPTAVGELILWLEKHKFAAAAKFEIDPNMIKAAVLALQQFKNTPAKPGRRGAS